MNPDAIDSTLSEIMHLAQQMRAVRRANGTLDPNQCQRLLDQAKWIAKQAGEK